MVCEILLDVINISRTMAISERETSMFAASASFLFVQYTRSRATYQVPTLYTYSSNAHKTICKQLVAKMARNRNGICASIVVRIVQQRRPGIFAAITALSFCFIFNSACVRKTNKTAHEELLAIYHFAPGIHEPAHLSHIMVAEQLVSNDTLVPIDDAHRQGLLHSGAWIAVLDSDGKSLVLTRGPHLVTCPNSYSLLGEHTLGSEQPLHTVRRGIKEELGSAMLKHIGSIQELPDSPVYYFRDYGISNENRIDRQVTYLWLVEMDLPGALLPLKMDDEVADSDWVDGDTLQSWFTEGNRNMLNNGDTGRRICHVTILSLWERVFKEVQKIIKARKSTI